MTPPEEEKASNPINWLLSAVELPLLSKEIIRGEKIFQEIAKGKDFKKLSKEEQADYLSYAKYAFGPVTVPDVLRNNSDIRCLMGRMGREEYQDSYSYLIKEMGREDFDEAHYKDKLEAFKSNTKKPRQDAWQKDLYRPDDEQLTSWLRNHVGYGVRAGRGKDNCIIIFDIDDLNRCQELGIVDGLSPTLTVAARPNAAHLYYMMTVADYEKLMQLKEQLGIKGKWVFKDPRAPEKQLGEVKIDNTYCIGPGSHHWSGKRYTITYEKVGIAVITADAVIELLRKGKGLDGESETKDARSKSKADVTMTPPKAPKEPLAPPGRATNTKFVFAPIEDVAMPATVHKDTRDQDGEIQGGCPWHDSESKTNFNINVRGGVWHCWRHQSGGGVLEAVAVKEGFLECEEAQKGCLRGELFVKVLAVARAQELVQDFQPTPGGNADRLILKHGPIMRFKHTEKTASGRYQSGWLLWNGSVFAPDKDGGAMRLGEDIVQDLYFEAAFADDDKKMAFKFASKCDNPGQIRAMLDMANFDPRVKVTPEDLDQNKWLMGLPPHTGAALVLRNQEVIPARMDDLITMMAGIAPAPKGSMPPEKWLAFLNKIFGGNQRIISFVKRACGYCLLGETNEQVFFVLWGGGRNGKSTFLYVLRKLWGDYAMEADFQTFAKKRRDGETRPDLMRLNRARIVTAIEAEKRLILDMSTIQAATGGEKIVGRSLFENTREEEAHYKLWLAANYKPIIEERHEGAWRRVIFVPFTVTIPKKEINKNLPQELIEEEGPQIMRWCLDGLDEYIKEGGLNPPDEVLQAIREYREENDSIARFARDCLVEDPTAPRIGSQLLYEKYKDYCEEMGLLKVDPKSVLEELPTLFKRVSHRRFSKGVFWIGLRERAEGEFEGDLGNPFNHIFASAYRFEHQQLKVNPGLNARFRIESIALVQ